MAVSMEVKLSIGQSLIERVLHLHPDSGSHVQLQSTFRYCNYDIRCLDGQKFRNEYIQLLKHVINCLGHY